MAITYHHLFWRAADGLEQEEGVEQEEHVTVLHCVSHHLKVVLAVLPCQPLDTLPVRQQRLSKKTSLPVFWP
jgi:hypothetical protein